MMTKLTPQELLEVHQGILIDGLTRVFGEFNQEMLKHLLPKFKWIEMGGGEILFHQNVTDKTLFFVVSGRLQAASVDEAGTSSILGEITRGESVGEMAFFAEEPRTATVKAIRDSMLASFSDVVFRELLIAYPLVSLNMTQLVIERIANVNSSRVKVSKPVIIGIQAVSANVDPTGFAESLAKRLAVYGKVALIASTIMDDQMGLAGASQASREEQDRSHRVTVGLDKIESENRFVLLVADENLSEWSKRCIRHCDELLMVADADQSPKLRQQESDATLFWLPQKNRSVLVLLHPDGRLSPTKTSHWLASREVSAHVHIRTTLDRDWQRLACIISHNTVGLALSGGGARGFAHLGVLRALEQTGISIDQTAGTSIGAVMAAYASMDMPAADVINLARTAFKYGPTSDFNFVPVISLIGRRRLRHCCQPWGTHRY
jgi:NTE family protein